MKFIVNAFWTVGIVAEVEAANEAEARKKAGALGTPGLRHYCSDTGGPPESGEWRLIGRDDYPEITDVTCAPGVSAAEAADGGEIVFWSCDAYAERLQCEDRDEAIGLLLDEWAHDLLAPKATIEVHGFRRTDTARQILRAPVLDDFLEHLAEEHGDINGEFDPKTDAMVAAEKAFLAVVAAEYASWACEQVVTETVNVGEWVKEHRPDWLVTP